MKSKLNINEAIDFFTDLMISKNPDIVIKKAPHILRCALGNNDIQMIKENFSINSKLAHKTTVFKIH